LQPVAKAKSAISAVLKKKRKNSYSTIEFGSNDFKWPSAIRTKGTLAPASRTRKRLSVTLGGTEEFDIGKIPFKSTERSMTNPRKRISIDEKKKELEGTNFLCVKIILMVVQIYY